MALYTKKASPNPSAKYAVEISQDPGAGNRDREIDVFELSINGTSIFLSCTVFFLDENGERVVNERNKPYEHRLYCDRNGPFVNPQTGDRTDPIYDTDPESSSYGEIINGVVSRYVFLTEILPFPKQHNFTLYVHAIEALEMQFIYNADVTLLEFNK
jgi:hypothetical protein